MTTLELFELAGRSIAKQAEDYRQVCDDNVQLRNRVAELEARNKLLDAANEALERDNVRAFMQHYSPPVIDRSIPGSGQMIYTGTGGKS